MRKAIVTILAAMLLVGAGYGAQDNPPGENGQPPEPPGMSLHMAALQGNIDAVRQHIEAGSDLNQKDMFGSTSLIIAATFGKTEVARALIEAGADLNLKNNDGSTALLTAAFLCRTEIVEALLAGGADTEITNSDGSTAFDAVEGPFDEVKDVYDRIGQALRPFGLELDYEQIKAARPEIAEMLRPRPRELRAVDYTPLAGDDWKVSTPAEQDLDSALVSELYRNASGLETIYGLLIIKNGHLIAEAYFNEGAPEKEALVQSVSKSYVSALVGIALEQGCLSSLDQKMMDFFPELTDQIADPRKAQITIRDLLQMRSGYPWEETDPDLWEAILAGEIVSLIAGCPLINDPGEGFNYSNLTSNLLGIIVSRACDTDLKSYAKEHLLSPIGSGAGTWHQDQYGNYYSLFHFTARDMARFGLLYLNEGEYAGNQVLSADWVRESLESYSENTWTIPVGPCISDFGYGYQWWSARVGERSFNFAWGHGGQLIVLLDDLDMIIVVTSDPFLGQHDGEAWRHEKANLNLVSEFINALPQVEPGKP